MRTYCPHDIPKIVALERGCAGAPQWGEPFWHAAAAVDPALRGGFVAEIDQLVCGYSVVSSAAGIAELESLAVSDSARRGGLGRALCERAMDWARARGATSIELEVRQSNTAALGLYRQMGFVEQGKRQKYYRDPDEAAILMAARL